MTLAGDDAMTVLAYLHNMGYLGADRAVSVRDLSRALGMDESVLERILQEHVENGYVEYVSRSLGENLYYLTGKGVIRVCSIYT
jgi:DNA-binding IclR family transcriptional regulator